MGPIGKWVCLPIQVNRHLLRTLRTSHSHTCLSSTYYAVAGRGGHAGGAQENMALVLKELMGLWGKQTNQISLKIMPAVSQIPSITEHRKNTSFGPRLARWGDNVTSSTWPPGRSNKMDAEAVVLERKPLQDLRSRWVVSLYCKAKTILQLSTLLARH